MKPTSTSLRNRFEAFVATLDGYESVDVLLKTGDFPGKKRADYLFGNRNIIVEQKSLEIDPANKPQWFVDKLMKESGVVFYGKLSTSAIFSKLPNGQELQRQMILKIGEVIEDHVEHGDKQARDTREIFSIPDAATVLVILNENASTLDFEIIHYVLAQTFQKKKDGVYRYPHIDGVILISEAQSISVPGFKKVFPISCFISPQKQNEATVKNFMDMLQVRWAAFNGASLIKVVGSSSSGDGQSKA